MGYLQYQVVNAGSSSINSNYIFCFWDYWYQLWWWISSINCSSMEDWVEGVDPQVNSVKKNPFQAEPLWKRTNSHPKKGGFQKENRLSTSIFQGMICLLTKALLKSQVNWPNTWRIDFREVSFWVATQKKPNWPKPDFFFRTFWLPHTIQAILGGGFKYFLFSPLFGEDSHFD